MPTTLLNAAISDCLTRSSGVCVSDPPRMATLCRSSASASAGASGLSCAADALFQRGGGVGFDLGSGAPAR